MDSSAIVKLIRVESESTALRRWLRDHPERVSSRLGQIEVRRALLAAGFPVESAEGVLRDVSLLPIDDSIATAAGSLPPPSLRSLDAIHLASAVSLGTELIAFVTYDRRLATAASDAGLRVAAPA